MFCLTAYSGILHLCKESFLTMFQKFKKLLKLNIDKEHLVNYTGKYLIVFIDIYSWQSENNVVLFERLCSFLLSFLLTLKDKSKFFLLSINPMKAQSTVTSIACEAKMWYICAIKLHACPKTIDNHQWATLFHCVPSYAALL